MKVAVTFLPATDAKEIFFASDSWTPANFDSNFLAKPIIVELSKLPVKFSVTVSIPIVY